MKVQTHKQNAFTIFELILATTVILIMATSIFIYVDPVGYKRKARDNKRFSDLSSLDRMVNEFFIDNEYYPTLGVDDLGPYNVKMPVDPINDATYFYNYTTNGASYEINVALEYFDDKMLNDGGNQNDKYEIGNNLNLLP